MRRLSLIFLAILFFVTATPVFAGTIVPGQQYSQFTDVDSNRDSRYDLINWIPNNTSVTITDTDVSGYIWGESVGWINLDPANAPNGGVKNTCDGELSGYAWGQQTGWVNFETTYGDAPTINTSTGKITGQAWSQNYGWIELSSPDATYPGLYTDWRPSSSCRTVICTNCGGGTPPKVRIIKHVVNNSGTGSKIASDFTITVKEINNGPLIGIDPGSEQGVTYTYVDGIVGGRTYWVTETQYPEYRARFSGDCDANGFVVVPKGFNGTKTCVITNDDIPTTEIYDCTDSRATNYNPNATIDDGSCIVIDPPNPPEPPEVPKNPKFPWKQLPPGSPVIPWIGLDLILAIAFGRRRLRGIVYDATTKNPLDPVYVSVMNLDTGKEIASEITDFEGRFGFLLSKGRYKIITNKTHYKFPSELLKGKTRDGIYDELYFGEEFHVDKKEEVVIINIPMDPLEKDWNQQQKNRQGILRYLLTGQTRFGWVANLIFAIGFLVAIIITYYYPVLWNMAMVVVYILVFIILLTRYGLPSFGTITKNGKPLSGARVKVFNKKLQKEIGHYMTTAQGSYFLLVPPKNDYYITVEEKGADGVYKNIFTSPVMHTGKGIINRSFDIKSTSWNNH